MRTWGLCALIVVGGLGTQAFGQSPAAAADPSVIVAQGDAVLMVPPDRAYVQVGAEGRAQKVSEAQRAAAAAMTSVQAALKTAGIAPDMFRTVTYTVLPQYDYVNGRQNPREFLARNVIEVRVDDLSHLATVIDAAGASGAAIVTSLRFDLKDRGAVELDAIRRATRDARERAAAMAEGSGSALGTIIRLQEQRSSSASPVINMTLAGGSGRGGAAAPPTPVDPGLIQVRAQVTMTVAIK